MRTTEFEKAHHFPPYHIGNRLETQVSGRLSCYTKTLSRYKRRPFRIKQQLSHRLCESLVFLFSFTERSSFSCIHVFLNVISPCALARIYCGYDYLHSFLEWFIGLIPLSFFFVKVPFAEFVHINVPPLTFSSTDVTSDVTRTLEYHFRKLYESFRTPPFSL